MTQSLKSNIGEKGNYERMRLTIMNYYIFGGC